MKLSRRAFIGSAGALALGFQGLQTFLGRLAAGEAREGAYPRYGPLLPDPHKLLDLPQGFTYRVLSRTGDLMDDGFLVPAAPDGMAAFSGPGGLTLLVRNHEVTPGSPPETGAFGSGNALATRLSPEELYDPGHDGNPVLGGTSTVVYDTRQGRVVSQHLSLAGTARNCAGGPTPWGSWITCEETVQRMDAICARDHGYCFEVPASAEARRAAPVPLRAMGRFSHEAVAVDPASGIVYETEDTHDSLIYRFLPDRPGRLAEGGRLQALALLDAPSADLRNWDQQTMQVGERHLVRWIDLDDVEAPDDDLRLRGHAAGAARFARGEGMWYGNDAVYFACTSGGAGRTGQIWRYTPSAEEGQPGERNDPGSLELFAEPNDGAVVENADNLTVSPWGDLVLCEDGPEEQFLVGVTPEGRFYKLGRNAMNTSEFAGVTFSPDGTTLFVNIQTPGVTLAISGPWEDA